MKKKKINWDKVWKSFNHWFDWHAKETTWRTQAKKVEEIVERQLTPKNK